MKDIYYSLPNTIQGAVTTMRSAESWRKAGIVFVHVPKAAGTSISVALYGRFLGHVRAVDIHRWGSPAVRALPSFAVTRNPWDRLVSAYRFGRRLYACDWKAISAPRAVQEQIPRFETFAEFVTEWLVDRDLRTLNAIYQTQCHFICDVHGSVLVDHVGCLERLGPTYEYIEEHFGLMTPIKDTNRSGEPVDFRSFYTPQLVDMVGRIYAEDVNRFGYRFE